MVNVLKFRTLFSFCSQIKCRLSWLEFTKCLSQQQTGKTQIWVCTVCLGHFGRILALENLEHLSYGSLKEYYSGVTTYVIAWML